VDDCCCSAMIGTNLGLVLDVGSRQRPIDWLPST
jgi:hypothetical protein